MIIIWLYFLYAAQQPEVLTPIETFRRETVHEIQLTNIGSFGVTRVARPKVPEHLHTGVDVKRPNQDYKDPQYIFPIAKGVVISKRVDGPFAQLILEHEINGFFFWTVYEHIAEIQVDLFQKVSPTLPIARFFHGGELDQHGWQFDHFHFEILKKRPIELKTDHANPERLFSSYTLSCKNMATLNEHFYDPLVFLEKMIDK